MAATDGELSREFIFTLSASNYTFCTYCVSSYQCIIFSEIQEISVTTRTPNSVHQLDPCTYQLGPQNSIGRGHHS
jgi:hypothetical protein